MQIHREADRQTETETDKVKTDIKGQCFAEMS